MEHKSKQKALSLRPPLPSEMSRPAWRVYFFTSRMRGILRECGRMCVSMAVRCTEVEGLIYMLGAVLGFLGSRSERALRILTGNVRTGAKCLPWVHSCVRACLIGSCMCVTDTPPSSDDITNGRKWWVRSDRNRSPVCFPKAGLSSLNPLFPAPFSDLVIATKPSCPTTFWPLSWQDLLKQKD